MPVEELVNRAADHRSDHGNKGHAHRHIADHRGGLGLRHHIAHDGAGKDNARGYSGL